MSFKNRWKGNKKTDSTDIMFQKLEALEQEMKRINTLEVYLKQVIQIEKQLRLMQIKEQETEKRVKKNYVDAPRNRSRSKYELKTESDTAETRSLEKNLLLFVQKTIKQEMEPIQQSVEQLSEQISHIDKRVSKLEKLYRKNISLYEAIIKENQGMDKKNKDDKKSVIYQEFKVDKLFVDHYEQVNNFGHLGIRELSGHLNIGTTYEKSNDQAELPQDLKAYHKQLKKEKENHHDNKKPSGNKHKNEQNDIDGEAPPSSGN